MDIKEIANLVIEQIKELMTTTKLTDKEIPKEILSIIKDAEQKYNVKFDTLHL